MGIFALLVLWFVWRLVKADFKQDYERVKNAHKAMELWEDDDEDEEQEEAKKKNNGKNSPNSKALKRLKDFDTLWDDITE